MIIYTIDEILKDLNNCIEYKKPFSHIRFGDGGLKLIYSIIYKDLEFLNSIIEKEGLPRDNILDVFILWGYYARRADYIDSPDVYFNGTFWPRIKKPGKPISCETEYKLKIWKELYSRAEIENDKYCNPESNCLMIIDIPGKINLFDVMKGRKICLITATPEVKNSLYEYNIDIISIVGQYENQYENSFSNVITFLKNNSREYDFFLVSAGELGRIYSGLIKEYGGRSLDIGFISNYWYDNYLHPRFASFLKQSINNRLKLVLTNEGKKYEQYI